MSDTLEQLKQLVELLDRAEREIERAGTEMERDAAEIARLRDALEQITAISPSRTTALLPTASQADHYWNAFIQCRTIALVALRIASGDREKPKP